jgi:PLP dependent protein
MLDRHHFLHLTMTNNLKTRYQKILAALNREGVPSARLIAVSKMQSSEAVRDLAALGQCAFGENYVQEALAKMQDLVDLPLEWHLIGPLQSNKCKVVAQYFDWVQTIDRAKLIEQLARYHAVFKAPLNLLIQVNIDAEASKSGCAVSEINALAEKIIEHSNLRLRGLMAIPDPNAEARAKEDAFVRMQQAFEQLQKKYPSVDTLSMGMSDDFELALVHGATMIRVGSAIFGARAQK